MIKKIYHIKISLCSRWTSITMGVPSDSSMRQREESMVLNRKVQDMDARAMHSLRTFGRPILWTGPPAMAHVVFFLAAT
jgi:hypothetical protein